MSSSEGPGVPPNLAAQIQALRRRLPTLEAVENRRRRLWLVAAALLVALSALVFLLLVVPGAADSLPDNPALYAAAGVVSFAFLLYVFDQERRLRVLALSLVEERVLGSVLNERVRDLATLSRVGQVVNSVLTRDEVLHIILRGARDLTGAVTGSVMLVDTATQELVVEVSTGAHAAPQGARQPLHAGVAGHVAETREPLLITGELEEGQVDERRPRRRQGGSSIISPMLAMGELIGILALEREHGADDFTQWELRAVSLYANQAATAVANAQRNEEERENVSQLADMIERRGQYVASLVEDLRAPLTSVLDDARMLASGEAVSESARSAAAGRIESTTQDLLRRVDEVLRGTQAVADGATPVEPVELAPLLDEVVEQMQGLAAARDGQPRAIRVRGPEGATVRCDPGALRTMLTNLLENAVRYSPAGSPIECNARLRAGTVEIAVIDQGRGIADHDQETIFERFRGERGGQEGVGLGLYVVRSLAMAQGGSVTVESSLGKGSTFRVTLPAGPHHDAGAADDDGVEAGPSDAPATPSPPDGRATPTPPPPPPGGAAPAGAVPPPPPPR